MNTAVKRIYRYPVKGLSPEPLERVALAIGRCLPHDRRFAIALGTTVFDPAQPEWLAKTHFIMLMRDEALARLRTGFDPQSGVLSIAEDGRMRLRESLTEPDGCRRIAAFFDDFLGDEIARPLRVVEAPGHAFADARRRPHAGTGQYVSFINLASIRALENVIGAAVDPVRFRANIYFDGAPAWQEQGWMGGEIAAGSARLRVVSPITRCAATQVNPDTAKRDLDIVATLMREFGHNIMGIYAEVISGGEVAAGDVMEVPP